jgi:hypothetical protein
MSKIFANHLLSQTQRTAKTDEDDWSIIAAPVF